jgi:SAM-dependent methyltransferase
VQLSKKIEMARAMLRSDGWRALARQLRRSVGRRRVSIQEPWQIRKQAVDASFDSERGVDTGGSTQLADLTIEGPNRRFGLIHIASDPEEMADALDSLDRKLEDFTFIDLGSGKGRALFLALPYPFRRIVGVEFALELHRVAEANLMRLAAAGTDVSRIELVHGDVTSFDFPEEPSVIYLYNPFDGDVMRKMVQRVVRTVAASPRPFFILYANPFLENYWLEAGFVAIKRGATFCLLAPP